MIECIGKTTLPIRPKGRVNIQVTDIQHSGRVHSVQALVLTKITSNTPAYPVSEQRNWTHLTDPPLDDSDYGTPDSVHLLLGADMFSRVVLHGRRFGPFGPLQPSRPSFVGY